MSDNEQAPATKEDLAKLRDEFLGAIAKLVTESETRLLKAFYGFAENNRQEIRT